MNRYLSLLLAGASALCANDVSVTIYNQNFGVVREAFDLDLDKGMQKVPFTGMTTQLEAASVVLRDTEGKAQFRIVEQSYRGDPVSQGSLLQHFEGKTIDFIGAKTDEGKEALVSGKIIRSGYTPGTRHYNSSEAIIEVGGTLRFGLPGQPLFPSLSGDSILTPTLNWTIDSAKKVSFPAELSYVTGGMRWSADYNFISPEDSNKLDLIGWVTINNTTGKVFDNARIKLMAGDVNKIQPPDPFGGRAERAMMMADSGEAQVTEKKFDEFHLYSLPHRTTLRDQETKQVEFVRATGIDATRFYVFQGANVRFHPGHGVQQHNQYGTQSTKEVKTFVEFENTEENDLGIPLPAGRTRFYRQDNDDGQLEFVGENQIGHTPKNETVTLYIGNAFDLVGERKQTDIQVDSGRKQIRESFEIELRNRSEEEVEIRVVENLYRWSGWSIVESSMDYTKEDSQTIEFRVKLAPNETQKVTYTVEYRW